MRSFLVVDLRTHQSRLVDRTVAAALARLDPDELEFVLDEEGVCETNQYTIVDIFVDCDIVAPRSVATDNAHSMILYRRNRTITPLTLSG